MRAHTPALPDHQLAQHSHRRGATLARLTLLASAQFLVVLNTSIVNVALPAVGGDLGLSQSGMTWVVNAYLIAFGALLPVGGRLADVFGNRRSFVAGLALFAAGSVGGSLAGALAASVSSGSGAGLLIASRAVQGIGAAVLSPAALAILLSQSPPGPVRGRALGVWGAASAAGGAAGVLLGGLLTSVLGWWSVFAVSAAIGVPVLLAVPRLIPRDVRNQQGRLDLPGALAATAGLVLLVHGLGSRDGSSLQNLVVPAAGILLLLALVPLERRAKDPLIPPLLLGNRSVVAGNVLMLLLGAVWVGTFFFLPLYQQDVLDYSPLTAGLTQLPLAAALMAASTLAGRLRGTLLPGLLLLAAGLLWLARLPVEGSFVADLLGPTVLTGLGLGLAFVPLTALGVSGVDARHAGVAGGLINTTRQVGGALGLALLTTLAAPAAATAAVVGPAAAAVHGYRRALVGAALIALLAAIGAAVHSVRAPGRSWSRNPTDSTHPTDITYAHEKPKEHS
ncbi:MFS transporter [Streptomyces sp. PSKA54]|uniref:MFS transporter n=1 Tax=Streptomyces himalayensis subsp. aureolus TaxID=2758039 RepID=A0A7W2D221_9ACTN|nr:MFS transporter [Streptomyces himalayensis]MBA4863352.1 MFS transporter [Streptomyces himalayensis subsp. aureolus]